MNGEFADQTREGPEIFIGLIGAVGSDLHTISNFISQELLKIKYRPENIRLSKLLKDCHKYQHLSNENDRPEDERINSYMEAGNDFRGTAHRGDAVALLGMGKIRQLRSESLGGAAKQPLNSTAYILNSLKHPSEARTLRDVYGSAFFLISVYCPKEERKHRLSEIISKSRGSYVSNDFHGISYTLIDKDEKEAGDDFGQNVRDVFPTADFFIDASNGKNVQEQVERFVKLLFNHPAITPTVDEYGMFHAKAAALRSADLSRQVGAVITTSAGEIVSAGCNEVPKAGGGSVWEGNTDDKNKDYRDHQLGHDTSVKMKHEIIHELFEKLKEHGWLSSELASLNPQDIVEKAIYGDSEKPPPFKSTRAASILEFGRIVHAEMSAITDAARRGLALQNQILFCTTFPCHMCARHIIASGIKRVVYVEPYPKSMAKQLYQRSIAVDHDDDADDDAIRFEPFVGVSPRRYLDFFEMPSRRKDNRGYAVKWDPETAKPRIKQYPVYPEIEAGHLNWLEQNKVKLGIIPAEHDPKAQRNQDHE